MSYKCCLNHYLIYYLYYLKSLDLDNHDVFNIWTHRKEKPTKFLKHNNFDNIKFNNECRRFGIQQ